MQLKIGKSSLLKELSLIQGVVEKKSTIPILSNLLLEAKSGGLTIKGTDLDVSITTWCDAEILSEGSVCIQAKKFFDIVRALPEAEIEIKRTDNDQITIVCERARFKMPGVSTDSFPDIKSFAGPFIELPASLLKSFIDCTIFAITNEESRFALNGAKFELNGKKARMVATDGHRLSFVEKESDYLSEANLDLLIPKKTLSELAKLTSDLEGPIKFGNDQNHIFFEVGKRTLVSRTLSGQFPNYDMVIPKENHNKIDIETARCSSAVKRVALMADERSHAVKFDIDHGQINITSQSAEAGEAGEVLPVEYAGSKISIGFNAGYLIDFFNIVQDGSVSFELKDGNSQALLRVKTNKDGDDHDYDFRYVVMPMRI